MIKEKDIRRILHYREDFLETYLDYLKHCNFNYYEALLSLCEDYELSSDDMKLIIKNYITKDILNQIEKEVGGTVLKPRSEIIEEETLFLKIKGE